MKTLIFDTETTGLIENLSTPAPRQPEIIEFYGAIIDLETGEFFRELDLLIKPQNPIPEEVIRITHIDNEMVEACSQFKHKADVIADIISSSNVILAHNLSFDMDMVDQEFARLDRTLDWPETRICTVEQTVHLRGYRLSLMALHEHLFGEPFKEAHRAKTDVQALIRCAIELYKQGEI